MRLGIIGVGGFAGRHHGVALELETEGQCRVVATCDPSAVALAEAEAKWDLEERGVRCFDDYREMLDVCREDLDLVVIPTPIPLHAEMHRACVERGLNVYLEKPPSLDPDELEQMIEVDQRGDRRATVGFNLVADEARRALKGRILAGDFGTLREVHFSGLAPRAVSYFQRAPWAARLRIDGRRVLDSCFGNAMSHYVHNALLWSGRRLESPAGLVRVEAEIYRAHDIEGADTFFVSAETDNGVRLRIGMTHACDGVAFQEERIVCDQARIRYRTGKEFRIEWADGRVEAGPLPGASGLLKASLEACYRYLRGEAARPPTLLEDCRPFVHLNALAYIAAGTIVTVAAPDRVVVKKNGPEGELTFVSIRNIERAIKEFTETGEFPSCAGMAWAKRGAGQVTPEDLGRLEEAGF